MKCKSWLGKFLTVTIGESWIELLHHTLLAATITCALLVIENTGTLEWLDKISLRISQSLPSTNVQFKDNNEVPRVFLIDDEMYENYFQQQSPLNRDKLAQILKKTVKKQPKIIVFDLDLSPGSSDINKYSADQSTLDHMLDSSANFCNKKYSKVCIVLPIPLSVKTPEIQTLQFQWMKDRCNAGIEFSSAKLISHQSVNLVYFDSPESGDGLPTLGSTAFNSVEEPYKNDGLCSYIKTSNNSDFREYINLLIEATKEATRPINAKYFQAVSTDNSPFKQKLSTNRDIDIHNKVVFIGGDYGKDDRFLTTRGVLSGVFIHAAGFYSYVKPIIRSSHLFAAIIDIVVGICLGYLFVRLWKGYNCTQQKYHKSKECYDLVKQYIYMRFILLFNIGLMVLFLIYAFRLSGRMLEHQLWLNPGPIIIGMFLHGFLTSKEKDDKHGFEDEKKFISPKEFIKEHPDVIWQIFFILLYPLYLVTTHH